MKRYNKLKMFYYILRYGDWFWGWEQYEGKPQFDYTRVWYDGWHIGIHVWKLWIGVYY